MPTSLLTRIDLDALYPPFAYKIIELVGKCHDAGSDFYATSGFRSPEEQLELWRKGRNLAGAVVDPKAVVTNLKFGCHNVGIAVDLTHDGDLAKSGLQPDWTHEKYDFLANTAEAMGLEAGHHWKHFKDSPHIQLPLDSKNIPLSRLRQIEQIHGMKGVNEYLDKMGPW